VYLSFAQRATKEPFNGILIFPFEKVILIQVPAPRDSPSLFSTVESVSSTRLHSFKQQQRASDLVLVSAWHIQRYATS